ncbi:MAG: trypsin-like peptidase domain-containing protein [Lachnospiraceae bacterium]|nr:trypsin-like peptidase domain-containing protein [Lachnospiraceae bacterium]
MDGNNNLTNFDNSGFGSGDGYTGEDLSYNTDQNTPQADPDSYATAGTDYNYSATPESDETSYTTAGEDQTFNTEQTSATGSYTYSENIDRIRTADGSYSSPYANAYAGNSAMPEGTGNAYGHADSAASANTNTQRHERRHAKASEIKERKPLGLGAKLLVSVVSGLLFALSALAVLLVVNNFFDLGFVGDKNEPASELLIPSDIAQAETETSAGDDEKVRITETQIESQPITAVVTDVTDVVEQVMPSVVSITGVFNYTSQTFWGQTYTEQAEGSGSGIIVAQDDKHLLIATNNHVVKDSASLEVQFIDGTSAEATIKGTDSDMDLAVIMVDIDSLSDDTKASISVAKMGDSDNLKVGEPVVAIGNALGYGQSVTTGVVSAIDRTITDDEGTTAEGLIQTDAAINPGNSGGALLNIRGEVIGINSSKIGGSTIDGVGFAIPITSAEPILSDIVTSADRVKVADSKRGYLGIGGVTVTSEASNMYGMPEGVQVRQIYDNTGAAASDLQLGDIIIKLGKKKISSMEELQEELAYYPVGETVEVTVSRFINGEYEDLTVSLTLTGADVMPREY